MTSRDKGWSVAMVGAMAVVAACTRTTVKRQVPQAVANAVDDVKNEARNADGGTVDAARPLAPLRGDWVDEWTLASGAKAFVTLPLGATSPRPIVLAVHGAEDRADWSCSEWHATTGGFAWVIAPQGVPLRSAYAWPSAEAIAKQAFEARDALLARYGDYVLPGPMLYGGFSQGASLASSVVAAHPGAFGPVVMVEAGHTPLSPAAVVFGLKKGGVSRGVISCSTAGCATFASDLVTAATQSRFELFTNDAGRRGHVFDGPVMKSLGETMVRLVDGDPRYEGFADAIRLR